MAAFATTTPSLKVRRRSRARNDPRGSHARAFRVGSNRLGAPRFRGSQSARDCRGNRADRPDPTGSPRRTRRLMKHPVIHLPLSSQAEFRGQTAGLKRGAVMRSSQFYPSTCCEYLTTPPRNPRVSLRPRRERAWPNRPSIHRPPPSTPSPGQGQGRHQRFRPHRCVPSPRPPSRIYPDRNCREELAARAFFPRSGFSSLTIETAGPRPIQPPR